MSHEAQCPLQIYKWGCRDQQSKIADPEFSILVQTITIWVGGKAFALTWYRALTWYCSPARPFAAPDVSLLVTGQQGGASPACRQLSRARNACAGSSSQESNKLWHGSKLGRTLCYGFTQAAGWRPLWEGSPGSEWPASNKLYIYMYIYIYIYIIYIYIYIYKYKYK